MLIHTKKKCNVDCAIIAVVHDDFKKMKLRDMKKFMSDKPVLIDVRGTFDEEEEVKEEGFYYRSLQYRGRTQ